jgi:hypothetical protein
MPLTYIFLYQNTFFMAKRKETGVVHTLLYSYKNLISDACPMIRALLTVQARRRARRFRAVFVFYIHHRPHIAQRSQYVSPKFHVSLFIPLSVFCRCS